MDFTPYSCHVIERFKFSRIISQRNSEKGFSFYSYTAWEVTKRYFLFSKVANLTNFDKNQWWYVQILTKKYYKIDLFAEVNCKKDSFYTKCDLPVWKREKSKTMDNFGSKIQTKKWTFSKCSKLVKKYRIKICTRFEYWFGFQNIYTRINWEIFFFWSFKCAYIRAKNLCLFFQNVTVRL